LRAKRSNPYAAQALDCFVASLLAMTEDVVKKAVGWAKSAKAR
jgi:hypothetical protein